MAKTYFEKSRMARNLPELWPEKLSATFAVPSSADAATITA
jgi:hypothetical protein